MKNKTKIFEAEISRSGTLSYRITVFRNDEEQFLLKELIRSPATIYEEEDSVNEIKLGFNSWKDWWESYKESVCWYRLNPKFVHESIAESIEKDLIEIFHHDNGEEDWIRVWFLKMNKPFELKPIYKKVKTVAKVIEGIRINTKYGAKDVNRLLYISAHKISKNQKLVFSRRANSIIDTPEHRKTLIKKGDIILVGKGYWENLTDYCIFNLPVEAVAGEGTFIIRPNDNFVLKRWYYRRYFLKMIAFKRGRFRDLTVTDIENLEI